MKDEKDRVSIAPKKLPPKSWLYRYVLRTVRKGDLTIIDEQGRVARFGDGTGEPVQMCLHKPDVLTWVARDPEYRLGEAFMKGWFSVERGAVYDFVLMVMNNFNVEAVVTYGFFSHLRQIFRPLWQLFVTWNRPKASKANVMHHYDLSPELYELFLDSDRQYSCAYFQSKDDDLERAQYQKKRHIAAKLYLNPGLRILDIGSGWGGMALYLARLFPDTEVLGITLSKEQFTYASQRAREEGLSDRVSFRIQDYRSLEGRFDRIVSVGMFEHVGVPNYGAYFGAVYRLLADQGVALVHTIGRTRGPAVTNPWIERYIFPGGYIPATSEIIPVIERSGLLLSDVEVLRRHYADTLACWQKRFRAARDRVLDLSDETFFRMWEYYLAVSEASFRCEQMMVLQVQLVRSMGALPVTRDYIGEFEATT